MRSSLMRVVLGGLVSILLVSITAWSQQDDRQAPADGPEWTRDYMMIVGSTTVFPFATMAVDRLVQSSGINKPMMQATGSSGGLMLFCAGAGEEDVDITCSSRRIRESEFKSCATNGVGEIVEIELGFDGIVLAASREAPAMNLSVRDIYLALAKEVPDPAGGEKFVANPYATWKDVNPALPDRAIKVLGPSSGSGTRTVFNRFAMEGGCDSFDWIRAMKMEEPVEHRAFCRTRRDDGAYIVAGEDDQATVGKLVADDGALAILSFAILDRHHDAIRAMAIEEIAPTYETIADARYLISRPLYVYAKKSNVGHGQGIKAFLAELTSQEACGDGGYLAERGLVPLPSDERRVWAEKARNLSPMSLD